MSLPRTEFITAATWHGSLEEAEALLRTHPELARSDIHTAAILGDDVLVRQFLEQDPASVSSTSPPYGGTPLVHLCLSKYLRLEPARSERFLRAARALLDAGADPNGGFWTKPPHPEFETPGYGAAGVAHNAELTCLLLERGADPNDVEVVYHSPESHDLAAMKLVVETGRVTPDNLVLMLIRKVDWHDYEGVKYLLQKGADPNGVWRPGINPLHHALRRDNTLAIIELLLDHGADPLQQADGWTAVVRAAHEGRSDVLELFEQRGIPLDLTGVDRLIAAAARGAMAQAQAIAEQEPGLVSQLKAVGGQLLAKFSGTCNPPGVRALLDLGVDVATPYVEGDGYWGTPPGSLAIHVAAWRACSPVVKLLIERGSPVDLPDARGMTPLALAIRACVDSYWKEYRSTDSARALLAAGASARNIRLPTGYDEMDVLLSGRRVDG